MQQPLTTDPVLVRDSAGLQDLVDDLLDQPRVAVDTESNSLFAYQEQVCLIQFSTPDTDYLLDPLPIENLSILGPFFEDPGIEKIFHAAEYDLMCLQRDFDFQFKNLFDTMIAARILRWRKVGLSSILASNFSVAQNKRHQRADWGQRPLPDYLLDYARLDTHYLIPLRNNLAQQLKKSGYWELAQEDFRRACDVNGYKLVKKEYNCWRINGVRDLTNGQAGVLQQLCHYRDGIAERTDRPVFKVMSDRTLLEVARLSPQSKAELRQVPGLTHRQIQRFGRGLLAAVRKGLQMDPPQEPRRPRPDPNFLQNAEILRLWRKHKAHDLGVESDIVLPKDLLNKIAHRFPFEETGLETIMAEVPWRYARFGTEILEALRNSD